ncbi:VWA domain-containing protein [Allobranchiibius sp. GilTou73]|uniref:vWA domain-containing protein n=1 Tax=Allobranchiibius sp. GilTou73 TaxID=2904523 RepID=UPI00351D126C
MASKRTHRSRYGRYVGGPDPLAPPVDLAEALDAIGEDVMSGYSPEHAMREFLRRGTRDQQGLDELARQVAQKRREMLAKHNLDGTFQEVKELLDKAVLTERKRLARDLDDDARFAEMRIENLPPSTAAAVNELSDYPWRDAEAREDYERIKDLLGREMLDQRFAGMKQALEGATDEDRAQISEMLKDLNDLLTKHRNGEDTDAAFEQFMDKHGDLFPEQPETIEELLDSLAQRAAAAQRMRNSMTQEQRDELDALATQAFGSPELMDQLGALDDNLRALRPGEDWSGGEEFGGEQGMGLGDGTGMLQDLADLDALSEQLSQQYAGARMDDLDLDALRRQLGDEAAVDAQRLAELERQLRNRDYLQSDAQGDLRLSPRAMRELGKSLLRDVSQTLSGRQGQRDARKAGTAGEPSGASRPWEFGDTESWDVTRTLTNATLRRAGENKDHPGPVISFEDVEVQETEARTQAAVALLVDTSFSMAMDGRWLPMKRTALALHQLISTRFRGDHLELVAFGRHAQTMEIAELTGLAPEWDKGTNLHHALILANQHFRRYPNAQPVLLVVTDGEPTAHLESDGEVFFDYPPHPLTVAYAVRELDQSTRLGAQTTIFRLGEDPGLARFLDQLAKRAGGRVLAPELDGLGAAVVDSYLSGRTSGGSNWFGASG